MQEINWQAIATALGAGWLAAISWIAKRFSDRLSKVEDGKANKESTDARFTDMVKRIDGVQASVDIHNTRDEEAHRELFREMASMRREMAVTNVALARIEGKLDREA